MKINQINIQISGILWLLIIIGLTIIGVLQPLMGDDYTYAFSHKSHQSLIDEISAFYLTWTGRIQFITNTKLIWEFETFRLIVRLLQGFIILLISWLSLIIAFGKFPKVFTEDKMSFLLSFLIIWFGIPYISEVTFWLSGFVNYTVPLLSALIFLVPYSLYNSKKTSYSESENFLKNSIISIVLFLLGFWVGLGHEILNVQLFVYFALFLFDRKRIIRKLPLPLTIGFIGFVIGAVILIAAPGNYNRLSAGQEMDFAQRFILSGGYILYVLFLNSYSFWWPWIIVIFLMIIFFQPIKNQNVFISLKTAYNNHSLKFLIAGLFGLLPFLFLSYFYVDRASFFSIAFINIFLLSPLKNLSLQDVLKIKTSIRFQKNLHYIYHTFLVLIVIHLLYIISISRNINDELNIRVETIEQQKELGKSNIIVSPLKTKFNRIVYISDITQDTNFWINIDAAKFYGVQTISLSKPNQDYSRTKSTILGDYLRKKYRTIIQRHRTSKNN